MRSRFDHKLENLHTALISMAAQCERAIAGSAQALLSGDRELAREIYRGDREINRREREIEGMCLELLLQEQPVAGDLRAISTAMRMITDLERIGDQAADISELLLDAKGGLDVAICPHITQMARACVEMVTGSVDAFVRADLAAAREVIAADDQVDALFSQAKSDLVTHIQTHTDTAGEALELLMVAKYLERIGDHAVNLAEWVEYSITGAHREEKPC